MKVSLSAEARADLRAIARYIGQESRNRAKSFVHELTRKAYEIGNTPYGYPLVPDHEASGVRRRSFGNYLIFYIVGEGEILIVNILHGARDYEKLLFPREDDGED